MACLTLSSLNTTTSFSFKSLSTQVPKSRNRNHHRHAVISCKTLQNDDDDSDDQNISGKRDRRNILVGLGGLYTFSSGSKTKQFLDPVSPGDCGLATDLPWYVKDKNFCPPQPKKIIDFKFEPSTTPRIRPAVHLANEDYIAKYTKAIELMRALPDDDPRCFKQQAAVHCAYCDGAYDIVGFPPGLKLQVHCSWLFLPFHRLYLYFFEKICRKLINDPNFAIPFWNYDAPQGMTIPDIYIDKKSPLYDCLRDSKHQPPSIIDLGFHGRDYNRTPKAQESINLNLMYKQVVSGPTTTRLFMGSEYEYRAGDHTCPGGGTLENEPHNTVHIWTGDRNQRSREDMGVFYAAARDPIFYAHHANVDRIWTIWKTLPGREEFTDENWLHSSFLFYDENAEMVRVKVGDSLDTKKLGYDYQDVRPIPWLNKPTPARIKRSVLTPPVVTDSFPANLDKPIKVLVPRPKKLRSEKEKEEEEEVLVIEGIEVKSDVFVKFDVLVNYEDDEVSATADKTEFAGSFVNLPHGNMRNMKMKLRLGISELLEDLEAEKDDNLLVTVVPRNGEVTITGIKIEYEHK